MRDTRAIAQAFERFYRERVAFSGSIAELAKHEQNAELIEQSNGVALLISMLHDPSTGVRCAAALALGRLTTISEVTSNKVIADGALPTLVHFLSASLDVSDNAKRREALMQRRAAAIALRGVAKHGLTATRALVEAGALQGAASCLELTDADTRESAAWLMDCIASHGEDLAKAVMDSGAIPRLVDCLDCSEIAVKRAAAAALSSIAQHGERYGRAASEAGAIQHLSTVLAPQSALADTRLTRNVLCAISQIVQCSRDMANDFINTSGSLNCIIRSLTVQDEFVKRFAASVIRDIAKHGENFAQSLIDTPQCLQYLVESSNQCTGTNSLPSIMALGHLSACSPSIADAVIAAGGLTVLTVAVAHSKDDPVKAAAAWGLGQAGKHGPLQAQAVAESGAMLALTGLCITPNTSTDVLSKCNNAAKLIIGRLDSMPVLDALLRMHVAVSIKNAVLDRLASVLTQDPVTHKTAFVQSGALQLVQELSEQIDSPYADFAQKITCQFPREILNRFSPKYNAALLQSLVDSTLQSPSSSSSSLLPAADVCNSHGTAAAELAASLGHVDTNASCCDAKATEVALDVSIARRSVAENTKAGVALPVTTSKVCDDNGGDAAKASIIDNASDVTQCHHQQDKDSSDFQQASMCLVSQNVS